MPEKTGILSVKHVWLEDGVKRTKKLARAIEGAVRSFARFHQCTPSMEEAYHG